MASELDANEAGEEVSIILFQLIKIGVPVLSPVLRVWYVPLLVRNPTIQKYMYSNAKEACMLHCTKASNSGANILGLLAPVVSLLSK